VFGIRKIQYLDFTDPDPDPALDPDSTHLSRRRVKMKQDKEFVDRVFILYVHRYIIQILINRLTVPYLQGDSPA
jgi:hypothetical protein